MLLTQKQGLWLPLVVIMALLFIFKGKEKAHMSKYFMKGTPAADIEQAMMSIPNFAPRRSGMMVLCRFHYRREDVDCKNCVQYRRGCRAGTCPYLAERLEAGAVSYETLVADCFDPLGGRLWARMPAPLSTK